MGFNNGYNSGYDDAKAEFAAEKAALEKRIAELERSGGGPTPTPQTMPQTIVIPAMRVVELQCTGYPNGAGDGAPEISLRSAGSSPSMTAALPSGDAVTLPSAAMTGLDVMIDTTDDGPMPTRFIKIALDSILDETQTGGVVVFPALKLDVDSAVDKYDGIYIRHLVQLTYKDVPLLVDGAAATSATGGVRLFDSNDYLFATVQKTATGAQGLPMRFTMM